MEIAMIDDLIVPINEAKISAHDRGLFFGDGVYEVVIFCNGKLFAMDRHMARLENSLAMMDMLSKVDMEQIGKRVKKAVREANISAALVYFHITRGLAKRSHDYKDDWQPSFFLTVREDTPRPESANAITHPDWRWQRCEIKSLNLLANVLAKHAAVQADAYEAILVDENGFITEGASNSVLLVKDSVLRTAPLSANILPGITRGLILEKAGEVGLEVLEKSFTISEALAADELMLAGSGEKAMGITQLDGKIISSGSMGQYTRRLRELLIEEMRG
jgi:D-alanine transaminase